MTVDEVNAFLRVHFSGVYQTPIVETLNDTEANIRLPFDAASLRPGATISGPTLMMLADTVAYVLLLHRDVDAVGAVTANLNMTFLARPSPGDLVAHGRLLRFGRRLSTVHVAIEDEMGRLVGDASVTYAMP